MFFAMDVSQLGDSSELPEIYQGIQNKFTFTE